jgi:hypothetical protein
MWLVSLLGGGLAGGFVNVFFNRMFRWRDLRTRFYPKLNNIYSSYVIRMGGPEGRYWVINVGKEPSNEDREFVHHRSDFISELVEFNELNEARVLRKALIENVMTGEMPVEATRKIDLAPEVAALSACLTTLHKKLKL